MELFEKIGVVGAGMMGSEIALMFALAGHPTILSDQERAQADKSLQRLHELIERGIVRGFWSAESGASARHNFSAVNGLDDHADRDLVIEAVFEDAELKRTYSPALTRSSRRTLDLRPTHLLFRSRR